MVDVPGPGGPSTDPIAGEARFRGFFDVNAVGMAILDLDGRYLQVNDRLCEITGYDETELVGSSFRMVTHPDDMADANAAMDQMLAGAGPFRFERRYIRADGSTLWVLLAVAAVPGDDGRPHRIVSQVVDITDRKHAEERHRANERRLAAAQQIAGVGSWEWDIATDTVTWSEELRRIYGTDPGPTTTVEGFFGLVHPDDRARVAPVVVAARQSGSPFEFEHRVLRPDGSVGFLHCRGEVVLGDDGRASSMAGTAQDVTEQRAGAAALREAEERFRQAFEEAPHGMALVAGDGRLLRVNRSLCRIVGYSEGDILSLRLLDVLHPDEAASSAEAARRMLSGELDSFTAERRLVHADGRPVWVEMGVSAIRDPERPAYFVAQIQDISERKHAERRARLLGNVGLAVSQADNLDQALHGVLREVCQDVGWVLGQAWVPVPASTRLEPSRAWYAAGAGLTSFREASERVTFLPGEGLPGRVWSSGRPAWVCDLRTDDNFPRGPAAERAGLRAAMACPIKAGDDVVCVIELFQTEPQKSTDSALLELVAAVAGQLGEAIQRRRADDARRESESRYRSMTESASEAIIVSDSTGCILSWNRGAAEMFGYEVDEVLGRLVSSLVPERFRAAHERSLARAAAAEGPLRLLGTTREMTALRKNGEEFPVELALSTWETGRGRCFGGIVRDITTRKRDAEEVARARDQALEASRQKSEFLAVMSHEIRTPMNAVIGMGRLMLDTDLDPEQHDCADTLVRSAYALLAIIDDVLDFSKVEAGKLELEVLPFDVHDAMHDAVAVSAEAAYRKGLELAVSIDPTIERQLLGDVGRLRQILINLIGNAVKFTDRGDVVVRAVRSDSGPDATAVRFEVADTGPGIAVDRQASLFEPFRQADASTTRRYGGTGLGLAICRRLVDLMDGELGVESTVGAGSRFFFTVRFPRQADEPADLPSLSSLSGMRALLVDDNPTQRAVVRAQLTSWGVQVEVAADATSALSRLRLAAGRNPYDLLVVDAHLCPVDVWFQSGAPGPAAGQLVVLVPPGGPTTATPQAMPARVAYLTKPVRQSELFDVLARAHAPEMLERAATTVAAGRRGRILVVEDNDANQKVARLLLERLGYDVDVVDGGMWAIEATARTTYAAILMDCQMPGMDGYATTQEIRRREGADRRTPIVAMTAAAMRGDRERCLAAGMDDYLSKPVDPKQLDRMMHQWVTGSDAQARAGIEERSEPVDQAVEWERVDMLRQMCAAATGPDRWPELIGLFLEDAGRRVRQLDEAVAAGDAEQVRALAHGLKGSSANFGAPVLRDLSSRLEVLATTGPLEAAADPVARLAVELERAREVLASTLAGESVEAHRTGRIA